MIMVLKGYGDYNKEILETIKQVLIEDGIQLIQFILEKLFGE